MEPRHQFAERVERAVVLTELREAFPPNRLEHDVGALVRRLNQVRPAALEHASDLGEVRVAVRDVFEHVESDDDVEGCSRVGKGGPGYELNRQRSEEAPGFVDQVPAQLDAFRLDTLFDELVEHRPGARPDLEDARRWAHHRGLAEEAQICLEVAEMLRRRLGHVRGGRAPGPSGPRSLPAATD
jgi:hypothetical protein